MMKSRCRAIRFACIASLVVLIWAVALESNARAAWNSPVEISASGVVPGSIVSAAGTDGTAVMAWLEGSSVVASYKPAGKGFVESQRLGTGTGPRVAVDEQGRILVAWIAGDEVALAERPPDGVLTVAGTAMRSPGLARLSLAFNTAGRALIAHSSPARRGLVTRAPNERSFRPAWSTRTATTYTGLATTAGDAGDSALTVWADRQGLESRLSAVRWTAAAGAGTQQRIDTVSNSSLDAVQLFGDEEPMVLYRSRTESFGDINKIKAAMATGGSFGPVQTLMGESPINEMLAGPLVPAGVTMPGGGATFAWRTLAPDAIDPGVLDFGIATASSGEGLVGAVEPLISDGSVAADQLALGALPEGRTSVVFGLGSEVRAALRPSGGATGAETTLIAGEAGEAEPEGVTVTGDQHGGLVAAWVRDIGGDSRIELAMYDEEAPDATIIGPATARAGEPLPLRVKGDRWSPSTLSWNLGDGTTSTDPSVTHTYAEPGTYEVSASVIDSAGNTAATTRTIEVSRIPDPEIPPELKAKIGKVKVKGPARAKRGRKSTFRVTVTNSGTAEATGVRIIVKGRGVKSAGKVGSVAPGGSKIMKVKVRPKKIGKVKLTFKVTSSNAGGGTFKKGLRVRS